MSTILTLPIARLRAAGCKVSTVIGHDPAIGNFIYSIRVPDEIGDLREVDPASEGNRATNVRSRLGKASASVPRYSDGHHVVVQATAYRIGKVTPKNVADEYRYDCAQLLSRVADALEALR